MSNISGLRECAGALQGRTSQFACISHACCCYFAGLLRNLLAFAVFPSFLYRDLSNLPSKFQIKIIINVPPKPAAAVNVGGSWVVSRRGCAVDAGAPLAAARKFPVYAPGPGSPGAGAGASWDSRPAPAIPTEAAIRARMNSPRAAARPGMSPASGPQAGGEWHWGWCP